MALFILTTFGVLCIGAIVNPRWALALLLLMFPLEQALQGSVYYFRSNVSFANFLILAIVLFSLVLGGLRDKLRLAGFFNRIWCLVILAFFYSIFSCLWTPSKETAWALITVGSPYVFMYVIIGPMLVYDLKEWREVLLVAMIFGLLIALAILGAPDFTLRGGRLGFDFSAKIRSSPLAIGELGGFLMLSGALFANAGSKFWFLGMRIAVLITGIVLSVYSGSRGQFFFAAFLAILFFPMSRPIKDLKQFFLLALGGLGMLILLATLLSFLSEDQDVATRWLSGRNAAAAVEVRNANATELIAAYVQSPGSWFTGLGLNAFTSVSGSLEPYSHSMFLDVLAEMGLIAFCILCIWLWSIFSQSLWLLRYVIIHPENRSGATVLVALGAYQLLLMNKQGELWGSTNTIVYFLLLAKIVAGTLETSEQDQVSDGGESSDAVYGADDFVHTDDGAIETASRS